MTDSSENIHQKQNGNLFLALLGAGFAAIIGAILWLAFVEIVSYHARYLLPCIGYLVGKVVHRVHGKSRALRFGIIGAVFSFFGCFMAHALLVVFSNFNPEMHEMFPGDTRPSEIENLLQTMLDRLRLTDILLYGLAIYFGFIMSYKNHDRSK